eukprot:COSAG05_NODE_293_length_12007_cov_209.909473_5_plen_204_part_00
MMDGLITPVATAVATTVPPSQQEPLATTVTTAPSTAPQHASAVECNTLMSSGLSCWVCLEEDERPNLVQPCKCAAHVHPECLETWINTRPSSTRPASRGQDTRVVDRHVCEVCREPYNLTTEAKLGTDRLCSADSWAQYITCCMLLLMFAMLAFVIVVYVTSEEYKTEENKDTEWLLWALVAGTGLLFISTSESFAVTQRSNR